MQVSSAGGTVEVDENCFWPFDMLLLIQTLPAGVPNTSSSRVEYGEELKGDVLAEARRTPVGFWDEGEDRRDPAR